MNSLSEATAAPATIEVSGKKYAASPLSIAEIGELEEHARGRVLSIATKGAMLLPQDQRDVLIDRALKQATSTTFDSGEFQKYLMSQRGMETMLAVSLRARHPDATPQIVGQMFHGRTDELIGAVHVVLRISGMGGEEKGGQNPGEGQPGASGPSSE